MIMTWKPPAIPPLARKLAPALQARIDGKTKPPGSLGRLEEIALKVGLIQGTDHPDLRTPTVVVFAGDHGLTAEGVSPFPAEVTPQMVLNFLAGGAAINAFARQHGMPMLVVDAGVAAELPDHPQLRKRKVRPGTANALHEPAMTAEEVSDCLRHGSEIVGEVAGTGANAVIFGEMGIGNSSAAALLLSTLLDIPIDQCAGRGAGHDDAGLARKLEILRRVQARHAGATTAPEALAAFGGCEIAMMAGAMIEAASRRMLVLVDGFIATAAAAAANDIAPGVLDYCLFSHASAEGAHREAVRRLGGKPILDLRMRLGEGTGAAVAWPIVASAMAFLREMATFESAGVSNREESAPVS